MIASANTSGSIIPQTAWGLIYVDSEELVGQDGKAVNAFDGKTNTLWHTQWKNASPKHPHDIRIDLGAQYDLEGFRYLPRQDGSQNGRIGKYEFYVSIDGTNWGSPVANGTFANDAQEKEVLFPQVTGRLVRLVALSEVNGNNWTSMAELNVLGVPTPKASVIPQTAWGLIYVDSEELVGQDGKAVNAFDGKTNTLWHTQWKNASPKHPHDIRIDLGAQYDLEGFRYLPRQDGSQNGRIGKYEFYVSIDGTNWGSPVANGTFANDAQEKEVLFPQVTGRLVRLVALSEVNGNNWTSMAELNVLGVPTPKASVIPQTAWGLIYVDSEELVGQDGKAVNAFDGKTNTLWHTQWKNASPKHPHDIRIDLGAQYDLEGFRYLPRQDGSQNGRIGKYEFYVSIDGTNWGSPVANGTFANDAQEKEVLFPQVTGRLVRLVALSEVNGNNWTSMAELNVLGVPSSGSNSPPDVVSTDPDTSININVLGGTTGTVSIVDGPANGTVSIQADNTITYTPNGGYVGQDSFIYKITDSKGNTTLSTLTIKVGCTDCLADVNLTLTWNPNPEEVLGYRVYYGPSSDTVTQQLSDLDIASGGIDAQAPSMTYQAITDLGLQIGDMACFQVKAYNSVSESDLSEAVCTEI